MSLSFPTALSLPRSSDLLDVMASLLSTSIGGSILGGMPLVAIGMWALLYGACLCLLISDYLVLLDTTLL